MVIRSPSFDDLEGLALTHVAAWHEAYADILPAAVSAAVGIEQRRNGWIAALADPNRHNLVCEIDGEIAGFASFGNSRDKDADGDTGELYALYVHPRRWRQGVGGALWRTVAVQLDMQYDAITVWVLRDNTPARAFYESVGFGPAIDREESFANLGGAVSVRYRRLGVQRADAR